MTKNTGHKAVIDTVLAKQIAERTSDAHSRDRYTDAAWFQIAKRLATEGADADAIEWILRSKYMRWAADASNRSHSTTAADFASYVVTSQKSTFPWQALIAIASKDLGVATEPIVELTGADLAGACEGEDIAELIDLAISLRKGGNVTRLQQAAAAIVIRITGRAK